MSQLEDYIKQAKSAGKSADTIRQELYANGWSPADLNGLLESTPTPSPSGFTPASPMVSSTMMNTASGVATKVGMSSLMKIILGIVLITAGGAGVYFASNKPGTPVDNIPGFDLNNDGTNTYKDANTNDATNNINSTTSNNMTTNENSNNKADFTDQVTGDIPLAKNLTFDCTSLISTEEVRKYMGLPSGTIVSVEKTPKTDLANESCTFGARDKNLKEYIVVVAFNNINDVNSPSSYDTSLKAYNDQRAYYDAYYPGVFTEPKSVAGIGTKAYKVSDQIVVLSSNKRYIFTISGADNSALYDAVQNGATTQSIDTTKLKSIIDIESIAKIVDTNLNKY